MNILDLVPADFTQSYILDVDVNPSMTGISMSMNITILSYVVANFYTSKNISSPFEYSLFVICPTKFITIDLIVYLLNELSSTNAMNDFSIGLPAEYSS